jgi:hypothetical protein
MLQNEVIQGHIVLLKNSNNLLQNLQEKQKA